MSKYIDDIIEDLNKKPETYKDYYGNGVEKGNIRITGYGSMLLPSITRVSINNNTMPTTLRDSWKLKRAIRKWYRTMPLNLFLI